MKKAPLFVLMALTACFMVFGGDTRPAEAKTEVKWRFAVPWPRPVLQKAFDRFCAEVKTNSGGRMEITLYPDGLLGGHSEIFAGVRQGETEMALLVPYADLVPGGVVNFMPWTVSNYDEFSLAFGTPKGILHRVMQKAYGEANMHVLFSISGGGYGLGNNVRPIRKPADLKNLKMRVSSSLGMVRALGNMGKGTGMSMETVPWSELYNALSRKVVDGCWSTTNLLVAERQYEVMKYYTDLGMAWDAAQIAVNREAWEKLPPDLKTIVEKAAKGAEVYALNLEKNALAEDMETLRKKGLQIVQLTPAEKEAFFKASDVDSIWKELVKPWMDKAFPGQNMTQVVQAELAKVRAEAAKLRK